MNGSIYPLCQTLGRRKNTNQCFSLACGSNVIVAEVLALPKDHCKITTGRCWRSMDFQAQVWFLAGSVQETQQETAVISPTQHFGERLFCKGRRIGVLTQSPAEKSRGWWGRIRKSWNTMLCNGCTKTWYAKVIATWKCVFWLSSQPLFSVLRAAQHVTWT